MSQRSQVSGPKSQPYKLCILTLDTQIFALLLFFLVVFTSTRNTIYSKLLNSVGIRDMDPYTAKNLHVTFDSPKTLLLIAYYDQKPYG